MRAVSDEQRRTRLAVRQALGAPAASVEAAVRSVVCLHATEPASVYLSAFARTGASRADIDRALYVDRSVVKQLAMRRTLFVFPRDLLPSAWGSASARVATQVRARLAKEVVSSGLAKDGERWVQDRFAEILERLEQGPTTTAALRQDLPSLDVRLELASGQAYGGSFPVAPRLLGALAAEGVILRGSNDGGWYVSRPRWTLTGQWLGDVEPRPDAATGYRDLIERWLRAFGPGTEADLVWWLGATKGAVRRALGELGVVEVALTSGTGYLLPDDLDDLDDPNEPEPWASLLPVLDPTTMGWKQRGFYLDEALAPRLFDTNGNAGTTAWWNGRVVGCWVQDDDGEVAVELCADVGAEGRAALEVEAERLTGWLDGHRVGTVYPSALMRSAR